MTNVQSIAEFLESFAPPALAEEWDNVGLLLGDPREGVARVMTCLTVTADIVAEAIREKVDLIVSHHPLPFRPMRQVTTDTMTGSLVWELAGQRIALYSPHTGFDSAVGGVNRQLIERLGATGIRPLVPSKDTVEPPNEDTPGGGRYGRFQPPLPLQRVIARVKEELGIEQAKLIGDPQRLISQPAVACGAAGAFLHAAHRAGCDMLLLGETNFHTCLEAEFLEVALVLVGHYASERFAVESLAETLAQQFPEVTVWASREERDPVRWV